MSLKGSLESFSLGEIFQSLSINQHTGTLVVHDGEIQKLIYFTNGHIIHLSTGKKDDFRLGDMLVWSRLLSQDQLLEAQGEQETTGRRLGEILVERGWATQDDISQMVVKNIEEEIYDLFLWKKADFEFKVGYFPEEFLDADQRETKVQLSTNSLIMEALRRIDEWSVIRDQINTLKAVFTASDGGFPLEAMSDIELPDIVKGEVRLVDGRRNVAEIVSSSPASKFEVCKLLYELLLRNLIRPLEVRELVQLAEDHFSQGLFSEARKYLEFAVEQDPNNPDLRLQLADAYTHTGADKAAVDHLLTAARLHAEHEEHEMTVVAYRKALELEPRNPEIMENLFSALTKAEKLVQAQTLGLELGELLREGLQFSKAAEVYKKLSEKDPKETSVRMLLAGAYKGMGDLEGALREYNRVADQLEKEMRFTELEKVYRILKALATRDEDLLRIRQKYERIEKRRESRERRRKFISYGSVIAIFFIILGVGWELYARYEYQQRIRWPRVYDLHVRDGMPREEIFKVIEEEPENYDRFADYVKRYREWYQACEETIGQLKEFRKKHMLSIQSFQAGRAEGTLRDLQQTLRHRENDLRSRHDAFKLERLNEAAQGLLNEADDLIRTKRLPQVEQAWQIIWKIYTEMSASDVAKTITFPCWVESDPPGAMVYIGGALMGVTPCVARFRPSGKTFQVGLELVGYESALSDEMSIDGFRVVRLDLQRKILDSIKLDGAIHGIPVEHDGLVVVFGRGAGFEDSRQALLYHLFGYVQASSPAKLAPAGGTISPPLVHHGNLIIGTSEGIVWQISREGGSPRLEKLATVRSEATEVSIPITAGPAALPKRKEFYYGTYDGRVFCLDPFVEDPSPRLVYQAEDKITSMRCVEPPKGAAEAVWIVVTSLDERVRVVGGERGRLIWEFGVEGDIVAPSAISRGTLIVGTTLGSCYFLGIEDGKVTTERHGYKGPILSTAARDGAVYLGIGGNDPRVVALELPGCNELWSHGTDGAPDSGIRIYRGMVLYGDRSGRLTVRDAATGKFLWDFRTKRIGPQGNERQPITALPLCVGEKVSVGDQGGVVTFLDLTLDREEPKPE